MEKRNLLFIGDGVAPTGFSTVMHNIIGNLSLRKVDIHHLAVNYNGDPHEYSWKIYPAMPGGTSVRDYLGYKRVENLFSQMSLDGIFILNDVWVIDKYLEVIKKSFNKIPPIVVYFPVDARKLSKSWFDDFDIVTHVGVYTKFAFDEVSEVYDKDNISIVPHGVDTTLFKKVVNDREEIKGKIFPNEREDFKDTFIVLTANRNQPRKRLDITIKAFSKFSKDKPKNVKIYFHCGQKDAGFNIPYLNERYEITDRAIYTNLSPHLQSIPPQQLNVIYNACEVGINTSTGEGWSLTNMEHAVTGAPQIVPNHSALPEVFGDCGLLVDPVVEMVNSEVETEGAIVHPNDVADALEKIYADKDLYTDLSNKALTKFTSEKYSWKYIVNNQWLPILREAYDL